VIWPLFHGLPLDCNFDPAYWQAYRKVNRRFARTVAKTVAGTGGASDFVWVHNYLLMHVAAELRKLRVPSRTAFFLHVPFPSPDLFLKLPWRKRLLSGLLAYDQVGFQTRRDLRNFLECVQELVPGAAVYQSGHGLWTVRAETSEGTSRNKIELRAGAFPVGVDYRGFAERAAEPEVEARVAELRQAFQGRRLILGVDHMDRTLGIPEKLRAFAHALERQPDLRGQVTLVQVVVPSRDDVPGHTALRAEIARLVGEINGRFSRPGWVPVHYYHRALAPADLVAHYRAADVALITPIKEGMNLVAKEFCAANVDERGVLVLSEFAGAAAQLAAGALTVNPHNTAATARTLIRALAMRPEERTARMRSLRQEVRRHDVHRWVDSFLAAALPMEPGHFLDQEASAARQSYH
jgi:trehalose 6-phosphate synthase